MQHLRKKHIFAQAKLIKLKVYKIFVAKATDFKVVKSLAPNTVYQLDANFVCRLVLSR